MLAKIKVALTRLAHAVDLILGKFLLLDYHVVSLSIICYSMETA